MKGFLFKYWDDYKKVVFLIKSVYIIVVRNNKQK